MQYEDRLTIETPEGVDLELTLAGLGSRFSAAIIDYAIQTALIVGALFGLGIAGAVDEAIGESTGAAGIAAALFFVFFFLVIFGYDILFEVFASGRTPGKRLTGLRVVRVGGQPITFVPSAIRNLLRLVDIQPGLSYGVGIVSILATRKNQRLGDIAAGTIVIRERRAAERTWRPPAPAAVAPELARWDVSAITAEELATVRQFLERRHDLVPHARTELARTLAERLRPKVAGASDVDGNESFLEQLAAAKAART